MLPGSPSFCHKKRAFLATQGRGEIPRPLQVRRPSQKGVSESTSHAWPTRRVFETDAARSAPRHAEHARPPGQQLHAEEEGQLVDEDAHGAVVMAKAAP